jgi:hypothetical protein
MNRFLIALLLLAAIPAVAVDRITATITFTNAAGTTNGQTITVNSNVRTWTNTVFTASSQVLTNSTASGAKTNLYNAVGLAPFSLVSLVNLGSTNFSFVGNAGAALTVTVSAGYASITYSTQTVATAVGVRVPITAEPTGGQQTNIASLLVKGENDLSTNSFYENAIAVQNLLGLTNAQTATGIKTFSGKIVLSGTSNFIDHAYLKSPFSTNLINYGNPISSPGSASGSEQFGNGAAASAIDSFAAGSGATASGQESLAIGENASATATDATAIGANSVAGGTSSTALGGGSANNNGSTALGSGSGASFDNSTALGINATTTAANQLMFGTTAEYAQFPAGVKITGNTELHWKRFPITTLATGNNAGVIVSTNTFIEVSGPGAAFTINGIAGGSDGKFLIILNQTGFNMTVAHESGTDPTAANRITSMTGADRATTGNGSAQFIYSGAASRWILLGVDP